MYDTALTICRNLLQCLHIACMTDTIMASTVSWCQYILLAVIAFSIKCCSAAGSQKHNMKNRSGGWVDCRLRQRVEQVQVCPLIDQGLSLFLKIMLKLLLN